MKSLAIFLLVFAGQLFASVFAESSKSEIATEKGRVVGLVTEPSDKTPLEYVSIAIYRSADSNLVSGTITDVKGQFRVSNIEPGNYYVEISYLGFAKKRIDNIRIDASIKNIDLGEIQLLPDQQSIAEVEVVAEKSRIEYKIDKRVINVDKDLVAQGGTAAKVLENTPSVQVDAQGNVSLRGSTDYIVLIDGKPSITKGSEALKQIPASAIRQIEVITNPSAKYEADGQAGIINVILKKEKLNGLSGNINVAAGTTDKSNGSTLINYRQGKWNYFAGADYTNNTYRNKLDINSRYQTEGQQSQLTERASQFNEQKSLKFKAGIDYTPDTLNAISVSAGIGRESYDNGTDAFYTLMNDRNPQGKSYNSTNYTDVEGEVFNLIADYTYTFAENHKLVLSGYFFSWLGVDTNNLTETGDQAVNSALGYNKDNYNYQYRLNADYSRPIWSGNYEMGVQYRYEFRDDQLTFRRYDTSFAQWQVDNQLSFDQVYYNSIYSGYALYSGKMGGVGYQVGIRSEYFARSIQLADEETPIDYNKFMFYPSVHLSKSFKEKHQLQAGYSRRINRPQPWLLSNTPTYLDPNNLFIGSPYLEPEFTDAFELNYRVTIKNVNVFTQLYYRNTTNCFTTTRLIGDDGIMTHRLVNSKDQQSTGIELGSDAKLTKWWQLYANVNLYHYTLNTLVSDTEKHQDVNSWDARMSTNFTLPWSTAIQLSGYYRSATVDAQGKADGFATANIGVNQSFFKGKLTAGLSVQDVFNSIQFDYDVAHTNYQNNYHIDVEGPTLMVNLAYTFNNYTGRRQSRGDDASFKGGGVF